MSETPTPETDAARLCGYGYFSGALVPVERKCYEKDPDGDVVFYEVAEKLERERDEARMELVIQRNELMRRQKEVVETLVKLREAVERERDEARREFARVREELIASKKVSQGLCARLAEAERDRDEARRELVETISCIEQAIDYHQVHNQFNSATAIKNLLENINQRRKHD